jgi:hypothetical protein
MRSFGKFTDPAPPKKKNPGHQGVGGWVYNTPHPPTPTMAMYSVSHQYLFMADTIFEHLKYQLDQK